MSLLVCPLCGKSSSLRRFDPTGFDDDIYAQHVRGLGRGRGFAVTERYSLLDDKVITRLIGAWALAIIRLLLDQGIYTPGDVSVALEAGLVDDARVVDLVAQIEDALGDAWAYDTNLDDDAPLTVLQERVDVVLREYEALDAEVEEP